MAVQACEACKATPDMAELVTADVRDVGRVKLCKDPTACRERAQAAGIWQYISPTPVMAR